MLAQPASAHDELPFSAMGWLPSWAKSELEKGCDLTLLPQMYWAKRLPGKDLQIRCLANNRWVVAPLDLPLAFDLMSSGKPTHVTLFPKLQDGSLLSVFLKLKDDAQPTTFNWHIRNVMQRWGMPSLKDVKTYEGWSVFRIPAPLKNRNWCGWPQELSWETAVEQGGPVVCGDIEQNQYQVRSFNFDVFADMYVHGRTNGRTMTPEEAYAQIDSVKKTLNTIISY